MTDQELIAALRQQVETLTHERQDWRAWAQFTYLGGGPATGTDAELRAAVCTANDTEVRALHQQLASLAAAQERMTEALKRICVDDYGHSGGRIVKGNDALFGEAGVFYRGYNAGITGQFQRTREIALAALPSLAASSRETTDETKDDDTRQSSPSPVRTTGSPRSPQPKGSER